MGKGVMPELSQIITALLILILAYLVVGLVRVACLVCGLDGDKDGDKKALDGKWSYIRLRLLLNPISYITDGIKRLKQGASESESRYKILTDNMAAAVIIHKPDGTVLWCSPYTEVLTGYSLSELYSGDRGSFFTSHVHEDDRAAISHALAIVATGESFQSRYRFYHRSGLCLWLETRTVPIYDPETNEYVALSITLDVTASVLMQLKLEERNRDLNEFTYMLSHDLKAPIVTLRGMLEILREGTGQRGSSVNLNEPLEYMDKAVLRLESLVQGVLELARVSTTEREPAPVDLNEVISEVCGDFAWQFEQVGARIEREPNLPRVFGHKTQLYQVFSNLIGNALKYRDLSRELVVSIKVADTTTRRRAVVVVADNGRGISEQYHEAIFKPFSRAGESKIEGAGVGLTAVKRLVEKLGGVISVTSNHGQGTAFTIELRRSAD
jgi:PAS domain S-box-containing protein